MIASASGSPSIGCCGGRAAAAGLVELTMSSSNSLVSGVLLCMDARVERRRAACETLLAARVSMFSEPPALRVVAPSRLRRRRSFRMRCASSSFLRISRSFSRCLRRAAASVRRRLARRRACRRRAAEKRTIKRTVHALTRTKTKLIMKSGLCQPSALMKSPADGSTKLNARISSRSSCALLGNLRPANSVR